VIFLENVEEFRKWGPTDKKGHPIKRLEGKTFWRFVNALQRIGYNVEWRELRACDYGAPTSRNRFYMIARCDGHPIVWPKPTHGTMRHPHRTAAECIDWSIPCKSIFGRSKPLAEKTLDRIARGVMRYVILNPEPFVVPVSGEWASAAIVKNNHGDKPCSGVNEPLHTVTTQGNRFALVAAFLAKHFGGVVGAPIDSPLPTITTKDHNALVAAHVVRQFGRSVGSKVDEPLGCVTAGGGGKSLLAATHVVKLRETNIGQKADAPLQTIAAQGTHFGEIRTFLTKYYGSGIGQPVDAPLGTVTTKDRFGVVTVTIGGEDYAIADIGMRMLKPKELFKAQGFDESYVIDPMYNGKPLTTEAQVRMCGNSVCPPVAEALVRANAAEFYGETAS
jgi:DNA (cytosine-5)-methyltransferase 1